MHEQSKEGFLQSVSMSCELLWQPLLLGVSDTEPVTRWKCSCWMCSRSCKRFWWGCWLLTLRGSYRLQMLWYKASSECSVGLNSRVVFTKAKSRWLRDQFWRYTLKKKKTGGKSESYTCENLRSVQSSGSQSRVHNSKTNWGVNLKYIMSI